MAPKVSPAPRLSFNLLDQLAFYGSYHSDWRNQVVHLIFVPLLFFSAAVWFTYSGPLVSATSPLASPQAVVDAVAAAIGHPELAFRVPALVQTYVRPNGAMIGFAVYAGYYILLEFFAGLSYAVVLLGMVMGANALVDVAGANDAWVIALVLHVLSWILQVWLGHIVFENRRPSLTESFLQSFLLAPFFVWFEVLFFFGYRPKLYAQLQQRVRERQAEWKRAEGKRSE